VRNLAFNYILADHEDAEVVAFNRSMLPTYYGLLRSDSSIKRLDKGHLYPKLEVPRLTCLGRESNWHSKKEPFEQHVNSYSEHLHMSVRPRRNYHYMASPSACVI
jgi:hypothetical protein